MFDSLVAESGPSPFQKRKALLLSTSAAIHGVVVAALVISGYWSIEKISLPRARLAAGSGIGMASSPPPGGTSKPEMSPAVKAAKKRKRTESNRVQPTAAAVVEAESAATAESTSSSGGGGEGRGGHGRTGTGDPFSLGSGDCQDRILGCADTPPPELAKQEEEEEDDDKPVVVPERVLAGIRTSGNDQIHPPDAVRGQMMRDGKRQTRVAVQLCLDKGGAVTSTRLLKSSGYPAYDQRILRGVAGWRYSPYRLSSGKPMAVCSSIIFNYIMK